MNKTIVTRRPTNSTFALVTSMMILLAVAMSGAAQTRSKSVSSTDKKVIAQLYAAWSSSDPDKVANLFTENAVYEDVTAAHVSRGKAEVRKWAAGGFGVFENFKMEVSSIFVQNGRGVAEWVWSATDKKLNKSFSLRGVSIIELRGGKIASCKDYYDFLGAMRQLGLVPPDKE
jgi:steroid delta-isomerase-like uncharacterized protein